jgi:hypothetical protein
MLKWCSDGRLFGHRLDHPPGRAKILIDEAGVRLGDRLVIPNDLTFDILAHLKGKSTNTENGNECGSQNYCDNL